MKNFYRLLDRLIRHHSVVGSEYSFYQFLAKELRRLGVKVSQYEGLLVAEGAEPESMAISVHVDRHGLICTGPQEFQYAAFVASFKGWQTGDTVSEVTALKLAERFEKQAVYGYEPWSGRVLEHGRITGAKLDPKRNDVVFEVEGLKSLLPGTPIAYQDKLRRSGNRIMAQLDNVLNVAILVHFFRLGYRGRAFFTSQEEVGRSWRYLQEWYLRKDKTTDRLLFLDTSPMETVEETESQQLLLRHRDAAANFHPGTSEWVRQMCEAEGITVAYKDDLIQKANQSRDKALPLGRTELGRLIQGSDGSLNGTTIQIPTTGYHTASESASCSSVEAMIQLLVRLQKEAAK